MTYERLTSFKNSATLQFRLNEENRLDQLAQITCSEYTLSKKRHQGTEVHKTVH